MLHVNIENMIFLGVAKEYGGHFSVLNEERFMHFTMDKSLGNYSRKNALIYE